ncbi:glycosyltransferase family 4 protein [Iningainema tapete]|uniref:Glycosyltransferase family 4 protein n=1 Tax=Iningainema tapete BLCC-T55 TaxID=2748662 RepID=A0A8J6XIX5_9CYAN|nr:glycosyltransferase family 4 protein [Iningainema tapete]MBD2773261.1 glycosyltransferase family 4 protein [Iningainema tapete BLCC-T55]
MKVLHLSTFDIKGGAARAAYRLHQGLQDIGVNSQMLVLEKSSDDKSVIEPRTRLSQGIARSKITFDALPLKLYRQRQNTLLSLQWLPDRSAQKIAQLHPDIINLHWISCGFMQIETLAKLNRPLVFTLHDMWAFTGGCHYSGDCDRYTISCGACPQLGSSKDKDLSRWVWQRKAKAWRNLNLTIVSPSCWLAKCASSSSLFRNLRIEVIPHGLDTQMYRPIAQHQARELLKLPQDKQLILFGAIQATRNQNKGFNLLQPTLQELSKCGWKDKLEIVIFGAEQPENPPDLALRTHYLGHLHDDLSLTVVYSAADVMIVPSIQEAFGQTAAESLACGTPVVGFNATGLKDIVNHQQNGYLAKPYEVEDLTKGIAWVLENPDRHQKLSHCARKKAEQEFRMEIQARRYLTLCQEIAIESS